MRVVGIVFGLGVVFGLVAHVVLLFHLRGCNFLVRWFCSLFGAVWVFCLTVLRFGLHVCEIKLISWVDFKVARVGAWEEEFNRRIRQLRTVFVLEPPFLASYLWPIWRLLAGFVLPDYLLAEHEHAKERPVVQMVQSMIRTQFRTARIWSAVVFGAIAVVAVLTRIIIMGKLMYC